MALLKKAYASSMSLSDNHHKTHRSSIIFTHNLFSNEGYVNVNDILKHKRLGNKYTIQDIRRVVENNDKQRFKLKHNNSDNSLQIKANQGHSLRCVDSAGLLEIKQVNCISSFVIECAN